MSLTSSPPCMVTLYIERCGKQTAATKNLKRNSKWLTGGELEESMHISHGRAQAELHLTRSETQSKQLKSTLLDLTLAPHPYPTNHKMLTANNKDRIPIVWPLLPTVPKTISTHKHHSHHLHPFPNQETSKSIQLLALVALEQRGTFPCRKLLA